MHACSCVFQAEIHNGWDCGGNKVWCVFFTLLTTQLVIYKGIHENSDDSNNNTILGSLIDITRYCANHNTANEKQFDWTKIKINNFSQLAASV
jgi:hypothetical protein